MSESGCDVPRFNAGDHEIDRLLASATRIAVVGCSPDPSRASHRVAAYLADAGFDMIPVNPGHPSILGRPCYPSLNAIAGDIDIVDIFRRPDAVPEIVEDAVKKGAKAVWMQEGIVHNEAAERARRAGLIVVMNKCLLKEHANRR